MNQAPSTPSNANLPGLTERLRLDKWLWAARFYKTRSLAADDIDKGRIQVNGQVAKASRELRAGDQVEMRQSGAPARTLHVLALSTVRGPAPLAQQLYQETPESIERRKQHAEQRRQGIEPADSLSQGRPTKHDRRQLAQWDHWSSKYDDDA
jgi:ribosome-associated heat shock protein Hsp15